jgi:hypothetical protein
MDLLEVFESLLAKNRINIGLMSFTSVSSACYIHRCIQDHVLVVGRLVFANV